MRHTNPVIDFLSDKWNKEGLVKHPKHQWWRTNRNNIIDLSFVCNLNETISEKYWAGPDTNTPAVYFIENLCEGNDGYNDPYLRYVGGTRGALKRARSHKSKRHEYYLRPVWGGPIMMYLIEKETMASFLGLPPHFLVETIETILIDHCKWEPELINRSIGKTVRLADGMWRLQDRGIDKHFEVVLNQNDLAKPSNNVV